MASLTAGTCDRTSFRTFLLVPSCRRAFVVNLSRLHRGEIGERDELGRVQAKSTRPARAQPLRGNLPRCNALERDRSSIGKDVS
jgi:hypothetical protein